MCDYSRVGCPGDRLLPVPWGGGGGAIQAELVCRLVPLDVRAGFWSGFSEINCLLFFFGLSGTINNCSRLFQSFRPKVLFRTKWFTLFVTGTTHF